MIQKAFLALILLALLPLQAAAEGAVRVRTGAHDGYSRLVFDWDGRVGYGVSRAAEDRLVVAFEKTAALDGKQALSVPNILEFSAVETAPLKVEIKIPPGSRVRDFRIGNRIVLDVYDPPGGKPVKSGEKKTPLPEEKKAAIEKPPPGPEPSKQPEEKKEKPAPQSKELKQKEPLPKKPVDKDTLQEPDLQAQKKPNLITLSSTKTVGLAVFETYGQLWIVTGRGDVFLKPVVAGPDAGYFLPLESLELEEGRAFRTRTLRGSHVRSQGGGLFWRVLISTQEPDAEPPEPEREGVVQGQVRGGSIVWPLEGRAEILDVADPVTGRTVKVVTVENSRFFGGPGREFVDFELLTSAAGYAIRPKVDDLQVKLTDQGVEVTRPGGLALSPWETVRSVRILQQARFSLHKDKGGDAAEEKPRPEIRRIYNFTDWQMGSLDTLDENRNIIFAEMNTVPEDSKVEQLVALARMYLAHARAPEAMGFLRFAEQELPALGENPEFVSLRGAAEAMSYHSETAFRDLSLPLLQEFGEVDYWRAFALADLGDWKQAEKILPSYFDVLHSYPENIRTRLALVLAEVSLRAGKIEPGEELLRMVERDEKSLALPQRAALRYLQGEAYRQRGEIGKTKEIWQKLSTGRDDLYRAKAGLALTRLLMERDEIAPDKAIDALERLRYAWRGDELEAQINYWLGRAYFQTGQYVKGLKIMRDAATFAPGTDLGKRITEEMAEVFTNLYIGSDLEKVSPLDAITLYEEFSELTPPGEAGDKIVEMLAEHLVRADLLKRAARLLEYQLEHRLEGDAAARTAARLAAIYLLDNDSENALKALDRATGALRGLPPELATQKRFEELSLLRARAYSRAGRPDQALALLNGLEPTRDVNRAKADIAWYGGYWDDAAHALEDVILDQNISLTRPLSPAHATLILNRAVALNLAGDRIGLANLREKYGDAMSQTDRAKIFEVVTRPRQTAALADRETLMGIVSEVDLFADFLNSYKGGDAPVN